MSDEFQIGVWHSFQIQDAGFSRFPLLQFRHIGGQMALKRSQLGILH
jgi:hypothetical protein